MATSFAVDVRLNLFNELSRGMSQLNSSLGQAQRSVDSMQSSFQKMFAFRELEQGGKAIVGFIGGMAKSAASLETAMNSVKISTGANVGQMKTMHDLALSVSNASLMTSSQAGQMAAQLARAGFNPQQLSALMPTFAEFGSLMHSQRGESFEASTNFGAEIAHYYKAYDEKSVRKIMNTVSGIMQMTLATPQQLFTQVQKYGSMAGFMGMSPEKQLQLAAMGANLGDKAFGTGISNIILGAIPKTATLSSTRQSAQGKGLADLGLMGANGENRAFPGGKFDQEFVFNQLLKRSVEMSAPDFAQAVTNAFNRRGARTALNMADTAVLDRLAQMPAELAKLGTLHDQFNIAMGTTESQMTLLKSNIISVGTAIGEDLLPPLTRWMHSTSTFAGTISEYLQAHPEAKAIAGDIAGGAAVIGAGAYGVGKVAETLLVSKMLIAAFTGKGIPVYITNGGGEGGGLMSGIGSFIGKKLLPVFAAVGSRVLGFVVADATVTLGAVGAATFAVYEGGKALSTEASQHKAVTASLLDATSRNVVPASEQQRRIDAAREALGHIVVHGDLNVRANDSRQLVKEVTASAVKQSGSGGSAPSLSTYSATNTGQ